MRDVTPRLAVILAWASYLHGLAFLLYFERVQFGPHVRETWQYLVLAGLVVGGYAGGHLLARWAPPRWTLLALLATQVALAATTLAMAWATVLGPASFSCPGSAWSCGAAGQVLACTIVLGLAPPLLVAVTAEHVPSRELAGGTAVATTTVSGMLGLGWGSLATVHPMLAPLGACITAAVASVALPVLAPRSGTAPRASHPAARGGLVAFRSLLLALVLAIMGFSMFVPGSNVFSFMPGLGAGIVSAGVLAWMLGKVTGNGTATALATVEILVLAVTGAATFTTAWLAWEGVDLRVATGMHHAITGLGLGFAWTRMVLAAAGVPYMPVCGTGTVRGVSTRGATMFWVFFFSFVVALGTLVTILPTSAESAYIHLAAVACCVIGAACWFVSAWQERKTIPA